MAYEEGFYRFILPATTYCILLFIPSANMSLAVSPWNDTDSCESAMDSIGCRVEGTI